MNESIKSKTGRRSFLKKAAAFGIVVPVLEVSSLGLIGCKQASSSSLSIANKQPGNIPWKTTIVSEGEPGDPLIITGTIYAPDGRTPLEGITLSVYQTDATGRYTTTGGDNRNTKIHGTMRTNVSGQYEFRTIRPGSYPGSRNPQHIHAYVAGPGYPEYWIAEYHFHDDPFIDDEARRRFGGQGSFSSILTLKRESDGVWRGVRDVKIEKCSRNCT